MKSSVLVLVVALLAGCAGMIPAPVKEEDKTFSQVFESPGHSKDFLYEKVRIWMAQNFKSSKEVIEYENKLEGSIIGNGITTYPCSGLECMIKIGWMVPFTMRVDVKDDKFRLTYSNLRVSWPASSDSLGFHAAGGGSMTQQGEYDAIKPILLSMGESIKSSVVTEVKTGKW